MGFKPTAEQRQQVMQCVAMRMRHTAIAAALRIDEETFVKLFSRELKFGRVIMRKWLLAAVTRGAISGKKSAIGLLAKMWAHPTRRRRLRAR
jgi:hypothetical protein